MAKHTVVRNNEGVTMIKLLESLLE